MNFKGKHKSLVQASYRLTGIGQTMKKIIISLTLIFGFQSLFAEPIMSKAYQKRVELLGYLRTLEPIVKNYRGNDKDGKPALLKAEAGKEGERIKRYSEIKKLFQEGLTDYFEGDYSNSYRRFLEAQVDTEQLLEEISEFYIEGTAEILKAAVFVKDAKDYEDPAFDAKEGNKKVGDSLKDVDRELVDISVEYGRGSKNVNEFRENREAPYVSRQYDSKEYHFATNKYAIEQNTEAGYKALGQAKKARIEALKIERNLERHQKLQPVHRKYRIEKYMDVIARCRDAREAAINLFRLKYPYDNYYLQKDDKTTLGKIVLTDAKGEETVADKGKSMNYRLNPHVWPKNINPVYDRRIPERYRRDASDLLGKVYEEEVEENVQLKFTDMNHVNSDLKRQLVNETLVIEDGKDSPKGSGDTKPATPAPAKQ